MAPDWAAVSAYGCGGKTAVGKCTRDNFARGAAAFAHRPIRLQPLPDHF